MSSPSATTDAGDHEAQVARHLRERIAAAGGWIGFETFMSLALYAPGLGYYAAGARKLGSAQEPGGDFVTAPELSPLFGLTLADALAPVLRAIGSVQVLEFGAGTGALAAVLVPGLRAHGIDVRYRILEVSADLRQRQQERLAPLGDTVQWLDALPGGHVGCVVANEVLDAMPVRLFRWSDAGRVLERGVVAGEHGFAFEDRPAPARLAEIVAARMPALPGYVSEVNLQAEAFLREMGRWLERGTAFFVDYGFPQREYYHPQRAEGTVMCHRQHRASADPLVHVGMQDITAHIDFTAMADAALEGGLDVLGYTSQARFLMNAGLPRHLQALQAASPEVYLRSLNSIQKLVSEADMGELFKVLAVGRGVEEPLPGFQHGDRLGSL
ncbi:class I SAM-dependent methyltransferase [Verticiella sediminum]|uniref:Class I SAM-dependent methyltransferase n=1 Tax=Verticiella sediminum TaxID=1247510 RepID=A0A556AJ84_9BURK|nr:SAM-dependent methyltransferase [Verticiella sediminum]TSH92968.1 class I SAM-dependent methyltransferase [Verticiella sediminum]